MGHITLISYVHGIESQKEDGCCYEIGNVKHGGVVCLPNFNLRGWTKWTSDTDF